MSARTPGGQPAPGQQPPVAPPPPPPRKAAGRSLADFKTYIHPADGLPLWPAERRLLDACEKGETAFIGTGARPDKAQDDNRIRPDFLRFLALGGDDQAPVHEHGVHVQGAFIDGALDLEACAVDALLQINNCSLGDVKLEQAALKAVNLSGSSVAAVSGDGCQVSGDFFMSAGFTSSGCVRLVGATIHGDLDLQDASLNCPQNETLFLDSATVGGQLNLQKLIAAGPVRCNAATIKGDVDFAGAAIKGRRILDIEQWGFNATHTPISACLHHTRIAGRLFMIDLANSDGQFRLLYAKCGVLVDDSSLIGWKGSGRLVLDGFTYDALYPNSPVDDKTRIRWLESQPEAVLGAKFRPQPWTQMATVLRGMGFEEAAKEILIDREKRQGQTLKSGARFVHFLYGFFTRYGYRPQYIAASVVVVWLAGALLYSVAYRHDGVVPADPKKATRFLSLAFSADYVLPVVSSGQSKEWRFNTPSERQVPDPNIPSLPAPSPWIEGYLDAGEAARYMAWLQTLFGWIAGFSLVAFLSGVANRNK